jgi:C_GCAxxG_C_C family probable redox protein
MLLVTRDETVKLAENYADKRLLCSESVLLALAVAQGAKSPLIPRIATGFGAGVGRRGELCGALAGAVMGLGIKYGRDEGGFPQEGKRPYWFASELLDRFDDEHGKVRCFDLLGLDLTTEKGTDEYNRLGHWERTCRGFIREATGLAYDMLSKVD